MRWFERRRRLISTTLAACAGLYLWFVLPAVLGADWPLFHARLMAILGSLVVAFTIEVALAGVIAWWEVQLTHTRSEDLPRAVVRTRSK
ncbi:MAG TPA: hypothetical protein VIV58_26595 [Kofleriaceae bacterium]